MGDTLFRGKKVALIGPAPHILERYQSFDDYDLVCRINKAVHMPPELVEKTGDRLDVLYLADRNVVKNPEVVDLPQVKIFRGGKSRKAYLSSVGRSKFSEMHGFLGWARKVMKCEPNRGMKAIIDILMDKPESLYITGFTFYQGPKAYFDGYCSEKGHWENTEKKGDVGNHLQVPQLKFFRYEIAEHPSVTIDDELATVLWALDISSDGMPLPESQWLKAGRKAIAPGHTTQRCY